MEYITFLPIATVSALLFYIFMGVYLFTPLRGRIDPYFRHPIKSGQVYLYTFDAIRGFAATWIAVAHAWYFTYPVFHSTQLTMLPWLAYGSKAVPVFCVLSGFLIFRSVRNAKTVGDFRRYALRRFLRVYPLYLVTVIAAIIIGQTPHETPRIVAEVFMLRSFGFPHFSNPPAWSLYVEVIFYMVLPFVLVLVGRRHMIKFCVIAIVVFVLGDQISIRETWLWKYFFMGIIASELSDRFAKRFSPRVTYSVLLVAVTLFLIDIQGPAFDWFAKLDITRKNLAEYTIGIGLASMLFMTAAPHAQLLARITNFPLFRVIGVTSYGLFLIHPFFIWACFPHLDFTKVGSPPQPGFPDYPAMPFWYLPLVVTPAMYMWAVVSYIVIERPFLKIRIARGEGEGKGGKRGII